jgi:hypothetical protein
MSSTISEASTFLPSLLHHLQQAKKKKKEKKAEIRGEMGELIMQPAKVVHSTV